MFRLVEKANGPLGHADTSALSFPQIPSATMISTAAWTVSPANPATNLPDESPRQLRPQRARRTSTGSRRPRVRQRSGTPVCFRDVARVAVGPWTPLEVKLTDLPGGLVPASGVGAVSITSPPRWVGDGFVSVGPCPATGLVWNVDFRAGSDRANAVVTPVSATGTGASPAACDRPRGRSRRWFRRPPVQHHDTDPRVRHRRHRRPSFGAAGPSRPRHPLEVKFSDLPGGVVPASGVGAVSFNLTSTRSLRDGFVTVSPCTTTDAVSSLNFDAGDDAANLVLTLVGDGHGVLQHQRTDRPGGRHERLVHGTIRLRAVNPVRVAARALARRPCATCPGCVSSRGRRSRSS